MEEINKASQEAQVAFLSYKNFNGKKKAEFLRTIAEEIEAYVQRRHKEILPNG